MFAAIDDADQSWALRIPRQRVYSTPNNPGLDAVALQRPEYELACCAGDHGAPVSRPHRLIDSAGIPVLITELCPDDDPMFAGHRLAGLGELFGHLGDRL